MKRDTASVDDRMAVWINWDGIARMLGWYGTIEELKRVRLGEPRPLRNQPPRLR